MYYYSNYVLLLIIIPNIWLLVYYVMYIYIITAFKYSVYTRLLQ